MMKPEWRRYAPLGLVLAAAAAAAALGLYIYQRDLTTAVQVSLALIVVGLAAFILMDPDRVRIWLGGRQAKYGSNALVLTIAFVGILFVVNYLAFKNSKRWDLTEDKQFTLAQETINALAGLPETVSAEAYYTSRSPRGTAEDLLEQFKLNGGGKFEYRFIDPEENPIAAEQAGITQDATIILRMGNRTQPVRFVSEQELATGLLRLINAEPSTVYFLTGHGEYSPDGGDQQGAAYTTARSTLERKNYTVKTLNLLVEHAIPADAKAIVIAGAQFPLTIDEIDLIDEYLAGGGGLVVLSEPRATTKFGDAEDPLAGYLLEKWGIELGEDLVVDLQSNQALAPVAAEYGAHAITNPFRTSTTSQFPTARSVRQAAEKPEGVTLVDLVKTSSQSWAETDAAGLSEQPPRAEFNEGQDLPGPVTLAVVGENTGSNSRVVVFGDSDFGADNAYPFYANGDLLVNSIDWAVGQEELISLTPKDRTSRVLLPPSGAASILIMAGSVCGLPLVFLIGGMVVFFRRRRRG